MSTKRGRGRPRKLIIAGSTPAPPPAVGAEPPVKRGPGRPRKNPQVQETGDSSTLLDIFFDRVKQWTAWHEARTRVAEEEEEDAMDLDAPAPLAAARVAELTRSVEEDVIPWIRAMQGTGALTQVDEGDEYDLPPDVWPLDGRRRVPDGVRLDEKTLPQKAWQPLGETDHRAKFTVEMGVMHQPSETEYKVTKKTDIHTDWLVLLDWQDFAKNDPSGGTMARLRARNRLDRPDHRLPWSERLPMAAWPPVRTMTAVAAASLSEQEREENNNGDIVTPYMLLDDVLLPAEMQGKGLGTRIIFEMMQATMRMGLVGVVATFCHVPFKRTVEARFSGWLDYAIERTRGTGRTVPDGPFFPEAVGASSTTIVAPWCLCWSTPFAHAQQALAAVVPSDVAFRAQRRDRAFRDVTRALQDWLVFERQRFVQPRGGAVADSDGGGGEPRGQFEYRNAKGAVTLCVVTLDAMAPAAAAAAGDETDAALLAMHEGVAIPLLGDLSRAYGRGEPQCIHVRRLTLAQDMSEAAQRDVAAIMLKFLVAMARALVCALVVDVSPSVDAANPYAGLTFMESAGREVPRWLRLVKESILSGERASDAARYFYEVPGNFPWPSCVHLRLDGDGRELLYCVPRPRRPFPKPDDGPLPALEPSMFASAPPPPPASHIIVYDLHTTGTAAASLATTPSCLFCGRALVDEECAPSSGGTLPASDVCLACRE